MNGRISSAKVEKPEIWKSSFQWAVEMFLRDLPKGGVLQPQSNGETIKSCRKQKEIK
jgi:hypothetical protein